MYKLKPLEPPRALFLRSGPSLNHGSSQLISSLRLPGLRLQPVWENSQILCM